MISYQATKILSVLSLVNCTVTWKVECLCSCALGLASGLYKLLLLATAVAVYQNSFVAEILVRSQRATEAAYWLVIGQRNCIYLATQVVIVGYCRFSVKQ